MSERSTATLGEHDPALEAEIGAWMRRVAPAHAPADLLEASLARTASTPWPRTWRRTFDRLFGGWPVPVRLALVVLLVTALAAGTVGVGSRLLPAPRQAPNVPAVPRLIRAGVVDPSGGLGLGTVVAGGPGLIAIEAPPPVPNGARTWTSSDGVTWTSVPPSGEVPVMTGIGGSHSVLRAVGLVCTAGSTAPTPACSLAVGSLTSRGWEWQPVHWQATQASVGTPLLGNGPGATGYGLEVGDVIAGGPGYVIVGSAVRIDGGQVGLGQPVGVAIATSADGLTWTFRVLFDPAPSLAPGVASSMSSVAARGKTIVAVGTGPALEPAVWLSIDGSSWDRVPAPGAPAQGELDWVAASPTTFVAVGRDGASAAAWTSSDGRTWRPAPSSPALQDAWMTRVTWTGSEFLAVGKTGAGDGAAWVSTDGSTWDRLDTTAIFKGIPIVAGAALGSRLLLLGQDAAGQGVVAISAR